VVPPEHSTVSWSDAPGVLREWIGRISCGGGRGEAARARAVVVGITGPVGSGKSTLARSLGGVVLSTDHYLPDYDGLPEHERDEPRHADLALLAEHLGRLRSGRVIEMPSWCFQTHRRVGSTRVAPGPVIACEGIFALHPVVRPAIDLAVYVDAPAGVRWARWERLEASGERGWGVEHARRYFATVAEPTFARFAGGYRASADLVVINDGVAPGGIGL
jgi:uridine kinase